MRYFVEYINKLWGILETTVMTLKPAEEIKKKLLSNRQTIRNFPKSLTFPFDKLYTEITTQIRTVEISSECTLFESVTAVSETNFFSDADYWTENYLDEEISKFWIFGQNGQGDLWLFDSENKVYFYDHNNEKMCNENFIDLNLNFEKWLQYADLNAQLDNIYDNENEINDKRKVEYKKKLAELSGNLLKNYPFEI